MLRQLLQVMEDSKVEGEYTRTVSEDREKPTLIVNIETSKDGDLCKGIERLHCMGVMFDDEERNVNVRIMLKSVSVFVCACKSTRSVWIRSLRELSLHRVVSKGQC